MVFESVVFEPVVFNQVLDTLLAGCGLDPRLVRTSRRWREFYGAAKALPTRYPENREFGRAFRLGPALFGEELCTGEEAFLNGECHGVFYGYRSLF